MPNEYSDFSVQRRRNIEGVVALRDADRDDFLYPNELGYYDEPETEQFDFWAIVRILLQRKWMIIAITIAGVVASFALTLRVVPLYSATATMEIQREEVQIIEGTNVGPSLVADAPYMETQFRLIRSRFMGERVAEDLDLTNDPRYANPDAPREVRLRQSASRVVRGIRVAPAGNSRLVNVSYVSPYPREAARIANAMVETFIQSNLERKYNTTAFAREFLDDRLLAAKTALEESERKLVLYAEEQNLLDIGNGAATLDENSIVSLNNELSAAEGARIEAEQKYLSASASGPSLDLLQSGNLSRLKELRSTLMADYQELSSRFKPDYPDMQRLQTRIDSVNAEIIQETEIIGRSVENTARAEYEAALAREASLRSRVNELRTGLQDERSRRIQYRILQREVETQRSQYEALLQRSKEVSIASGVGSSNVSMVDPALVPGRPFQPNLNRSLLQAFVLSFGFGVGLAFLLNFIDDTIKTPDDIRNKLGLTVLGVVPKVPSKTDIVSEVLNKPKSTTSEAFASVQAALEFSSSEGMPSSILITSTRPGEGKTSTTVALASVLALGGKKVLIIDGDMRKPSFVIDSDESKGLSGLLTSGDLLVDHVVQSKTNGLSILPSGVIPPNPAQLLSGPRLRQIIQEAERAFDVVIIDSPPVMSFADSPRLGSVVSAVMMVIQSGKIRTPSAKRTLSNLHEARTNILGTILSKFDPRKQGYEYSYYYHAYGNDATAYIATKSKKDRMRKVLIEAADKPSTQDETEKWA
ncbi:MAG: polysaccharide biosynthesis tyrosine autokinase [Pseudomonadota bacterium]